MARTSGGCSGSVRAHCRRYALDPDATTVVPVETAKDDGAGRGLVLVVEDEAAIADVQRRYLLDAGFGVEVATDGPTALTAVRRWRPVAVVLDVGLPGPDGMDGIDVCRQLRDEGDWTPVLFVTARDDEVDRVLGLEVGGDDYVTKPFSPRELVARVKAVLRRRDVPNGALLRAGGVRLDPATRRVTAAGDEVALTMTEFNLLHALVAARGRVVDRAELLASAWGQADHAGGTRTVDVHVAQLRAKLGDASPIETVRGVGYRVAGSPS